MAVDKFEFHVNSWLNDKALHKCTLDAQGLWINLICLMQKSPVRGKLLHKRGEPIKSNEIPDLIKKSDVIVEPLLQELIENKVLRTDDAGAFYSKKLLEVNDKKKKEKEPFYKESIDFYFDWHNVKFNVKPRMSVVDGQSLKQILQHFASMETEKHNRFELFKLMLNNWHKLDTYLQNATDLRHINSNLTRILTCLRNTKKNGSSTKLEAIVEANKNIEGFDYNTLKKNV